MPDFVVNARCDVLVQDGVIEDVIIRGRKYLDAGATCVFVWGGRLRGGVTREEVRKCVEVFRGRLSEILNLPMRGGGLRANELADIGVCRMCTGPQLQAVAVEACKSEAAKILS